MSWFGSVQIREVIYTCLAVADPRGGREVDRPPPRDPKKEKNGAKGKEEEKEKEEKEKEKGKRRGKAQ